MNAKNTTIGNSRFPFARNKKTNQEESLLSSPSLFLLSFLFRIKENDMSVGCKVFTTEKEWEYKKTKEEKKRDREVLNLFFPA